jgi:hypothetical protein
VEHPHVNLYVPGEEFPYLKKADIQEVFDSRTAELTEEDTEELTVLSEPQDGEDSDAVVKRPQLTTSTLKKGLQMVDALADHFLEADYFMDMCLKFKHKIMLVMAPKTETYNNM